MHERNIKLWKIAGILHEKQNYLQSFFASTYSGRLRRRERERKQKKGFKKERKIH